MFCSQFFSGFALLLLMLVHTVLMFVVFSCWSLCRLVNSTEVDSTVGATNDDLFRTCLSWHLLTVFQCR